MVLREEEEGVGLEEVVGAAARRAAASRLMVRKRPSILWYVAPGKGLSDLGTGGGRERGGRTFSEHAGDFVIVGLGGMLVSWRFWRGGARLRGMELNGLKINRRGNFEGGKNKTVIR